MVSSLCLCQGRLAGLVQNRPILGNRMDLERPRLGGEFGIIEYLLPEVREALRQAPDEGAS